MGIWIELGVFLLVVVFAIHQLNDLKKEKLKREQKNKTESSDHDSR
jgi:hypothetical protein